MRITSSMYYKNLYARNSDTINNSLYDVNKQISSGVKIQYAHDDLRIFSDTMRLDNEVTVLAQIKTSTSSALKFSDQTDSVLNEFESSMNRTRTLLLNASNGTHDNTSIDAIANELREIEQHLKNLANTSINGQFLFAGSNTDIKPISDDGTYTGNSATLDAFTGSRTRQTYNISGAELFLGEKKLVNREVSTNIVNKNLITMYPALQVTPTTDASLTSQSTIRDLMGDTDNVIDALNNKHFFYVSGVKSTGESFEQKLSFKDTDKIDDLLTQIGSLYGNTLDTKVVNVSLNQSGEIVVEDKIKGSSRLDFHIVGAIDFSGGAAANVNDIDNLGVGETSFNKIMLGTSTATNPNLYVKEFIKSSFNSASSVPGTNLIEGTIYDRTQFIANGPKISSNISQIVKGTNTFATADTKLIDVASGSSLNGKSFVFEGININGIAYNATVDLATAGSTFTISGNTYTIYNMDNPRAAVDADEMTYKQLMDVMNMIITNNLPSAAPGTSTQYDTAIANAELMGGVSLTYDGKIEFQEIGTGNTNARIALYDSNSGDFSNPASVMRFNANNALTVRDPKTDFFKTFNEIVTAVENYNLYPDATSTDVRNIGIENAIAMMDDLQDHIFRIHSKVGAQTNALTTSIERTKLLEISTKTLRSSVLDTDLAEAYLQLAQLNTNYEAMLSTVGKVSKLSLVNYL